MTQRIELIIQSRSPELSEAEENAVLYNIKNIFGEDVTISVGDSADAEQTPDGPTTESTAAIGTVAVTDQDAITAVINHVRDSEYIELGDVVDADGRPLIEIADDGPVDNDLNLIKTKYNIDKTTKLVEPASEKKREK
jgi:hypothetical protein